jgi:hypothetical protein
MPQVSSDVGLLRDAPLKTIQLAGISLRIPYIRHYPEQDINVSLLANIIDGAWEPRKMIHRLLMRVN